MAKPTKRSAPARIEDQPEPSIAQLVEASREAPNVPIDCGFVRETEFGGVELVLFAYRRGGPPGSMETVAVVAYEPDEFVARYKANAGFAGLLEEQLEKTGRGERGALARQAEATLAQTEQTDPSHVALAPANYLSYEAVSELLYHTGQRGGIVFVGVLPVLRHQAAVAHQAAMAQKPNADPMRAAAVPASLLMSATMPSRALADLLVSWKCIADAIEAKRPS